MVSMISVESGGKSLVGTDYRIRGQEEEVERDRQMLLRNFSLNISRDMGWSLERCGIKE